MRCFLSFLVCPTILFLGVLLSPPFVHAAAPAEGECDSADADLGLDDAAGLSLVQRHARVALAQRTKSTAVPQDATRTVHKAAATSPGHVSAATEKPADTVSGSVDSPVVDMLGPVPLSLLAFTTEVHPVDKSNLSLMSRLSTLASSGNSFLYFIIPLIIVVVIAMLFIACGLQFAKGSAETGPKTTAPGHGSPRPVSRTQSGGATGTMPTQSSLASSSSSLQRSYISPVVPSIRQPVQQQPKTPACLLFPTKAADVRIRSDSFSVFWGSLDKAWFQLDVKAGGDGDVLELSEVHSGDPSLLATVNLGSGGSSGFADGSSLWLVTNDNLQAVTRGLAYRSGKNNTKIPNAVASWGSTVPGISTGDGWLKVGDWYLPITVDGNIVLKEIESAKVLKNAGIQIMGLNGTPFATIRPTSGGQYSILRNGAVVAGISIGTSSYLVEAKMPNGKRVATVSKDQVKVPTGDMMLDLVVEPQMDPVMMLLGCVAVLRQLPPHQE